MEPSNFLEIFNSGGIVGVLAVFGWYMVKERDKLEKTRTEEMLKQQQLSLDREKRLADRIDLVETFVRDQLITGRAKMIDALNRSTDAHDELCKTIASLPCQSVNRQALHDFMASAQSERKE